MTYDIEDEGLKYLQERMTEFLFFKKDNRIEQQG